MTEGEWNNCTDPQVMLDFLREQGKLTERKARLFEVACCRRIWPLLTDERSRKAVEVAEKYADGVVDQQQRSCAEAEAKQAAAGSNGWNWFAALAAKMTVASHIPLLRVVRSTPVDNALQPAEIEARRRGQAHLLRDLFGPIPLRSMALPPSVRRWDDGCVVKLAGAIYEERSLPEGTLDVRGMCVLADALEDAGCQDADILGHCRGPGPHVRGCWVVDLLLGKS